MEVKGCWRIVIHKVEMQELVSIYGRHAVHASSVCSAGEATSSIAMKTVREPERKVLHGRLWQRLVTLGPQ